MFNNGIGFYKLVVNILFFVNLEAGDYYISFQYATKDYIQIYSKFNCSKTLIPTTQKGKFLFSLPSNYPQKDVIKFCYKNRDKIVDKLLQQNIILIAREKSYNTYLETHKKLTFLPHKFDIIIKNGYAYFYLKEE